MALTQAGGAVVSIITEDNNGKQSSTQFPLDPEITTTAALLTAANAIRDAVAALSDAAIVGASVSFGYAEGATVVPAPESEVERKLVLSLSNGQRGPVKSVLRIPSPRASLETANTDNIDPANPTVAASVGVILNNTRTTRGEVLNTLDDVYVTHVSRKRR